jgi:peroxiredoxin
MDHRTDRPLMDRPVIRAGLAVVLLAVLAAVFLAIRAGRDDGGDDAQIIAPPTGQASAAPDDGDTGPIDGSGPVVGQPAPTFALRNADGEIVKLTDLRGKVVWINFWATWCRPCKQELPDIQKLYGEKRGQGLEVLTINYQDPREDAIAYFRDNNLEIPMLLDPNGSVYDQYRLQGLPDSFFVDRDGNVAALHYGYMTEEKMRQRLEQAGLP